MSERVSSDRLLKSKGYSFIEYVEPGVEPEYSDITFSDVIEEFSLLDIGFKRLFKHQYEAYEELMQGRNVVLVSGTGSGKTEAWFLYFAKMLKSDAGFRALALYPTLALANDQIKRLARYMSALKREVLQLDSTKKNEYIKLIGKHGLLSKISTSNLVVTNPAFLLHDMKKYFVRKESALLSSIYNKISLLVIDELDFYSPRSLALLLAMIYLLSAISEKPLQVAVLSAGIANPEDLCNYLESVTRRKCTVVRGKPFRVENRVYVVLGKNLYEVWNIIKNVLATGAMRSELAYLSKLVSDFETFKSNAYYVLSVLEGLGFEVPTLGLDPAELIAEYFKDKYVTLVFTRSINTAEEFVRSIKAKYGSDAPIASHHHLISKKLREEIEEGARSGRLKVIVSPRTLSQGIDIGLVSRVVHLGLPDDVREFYQREGRKGRRPELEFSETIIIPHSRWDRELLSSGLETFKKWLELGIEKTLVNPDNLYIYLLTGVVKLKSPWFKLDLNEKELAALKSAGIISPEGKINEAALNATYERLNFYEYAPPYGIKRYIERGDKVTPLEPIGHVDLVEKFQPGCIDYSEDGIVVSLDYGRSSRHVKAVIEKDIRQVDFRSHDGLAVALEEYNYLKLKWGEKPNVLRDLLAGRLTSEVLCVVYVPRDGFGKYVKIPERCTWYLRSEKPKVLWSGGKPIVFHEKRAIYVPMPTGGEYRDFTYGYSYSVDMREDAELMRLALAYIMVVLRRRFGIPLNTIMYDVTKIGEYKYFSLYEPEAAGVINKLDWLLVRRAVEQHEPEDLDRIMISEVDDLAYSTLITIDFNWDIVKEQALRVVDYVLARQKVKALLWGREVYLPRPSPALKVLSYVIMSEVLNDGRPVPSLISGHRAFDGDKFIGSIALYPPIPLIKPPKELLEVENYILDKVYYENFKLLVEDSNVVLQQLKQANMRRLASLLENSREFVIDARSVVEQLGIRGLSMEEVARAAGFEPLTNYAKVREILKSISEKSSLHQKEQELLLKYLEDRAKILYIAYLAINELAKQAT
jgi:DEAD/DEAH box helicase domain-containing protein